MSAKDIPDLDLSIITLGILENHAPTLALHVNSTAVQLCPPIIDDHLTILQCLQLVKLYQSQPLLNNILRSIVTGDWGIRVKLDEWSVEERLLVGRGLLDVLAALQGQPKGFAGAAHIEVKIVDGESRSWIPTHCLSGLVRCTVDQWECLRCTGIYEDAAEAMYGPLVVL
jgi:hypothetical protein